MRRVSYLSTKCHSAVQLGALIYPRRNAEKSLLPHGPEESATGPWPDGEVGHPKAAWPRSLLDAGIRNKHHYHGEEYAAGGRRRPFRVPAAFFRQLDLSPKVRTDVIPHTRLPTPCLLALLA